VGPGALGLKPGRGPNLELAIGVTIVGYGEQGNTIDNIEASVEAIIRHNACLTTFAAFPYLHALFLRFTRFPFGFAFRYDLSGFRTPVDGFFLWCWHDDLGSL
jgi:hypothetical protein